MDSLILIQIWIWIQQIEYGLSQSSANLAVSFVRRSAQNQAENGCISEVS